MSLDVYNKVQLKLAQQTPIQALAVHTWIGNKF